MSTQSLTVLMAMLQTNTHRSVTVIKYLLGMTRSPEDRTLYNAARPFRVIGGVSDLGECSHR